MTLPTPLEQKVTRDCPEHGNSKKAKELFWEHPLTSHWGCKCKEQKVTKPRGEKIFSNYPFKRFNNWNWLWLWAIPTYVVTDDGYATFFKKFRGITYVTKMEELPSRRSK